MNDFFDTEEDFYVNYNNEHKIYLENPFIV